MHLACSVGSIASLLSQNCKAIVVLRAPELKSDIAPTPTRARLTLAYTLDSVFGCSVDTVTH